MIHFAREITARELADLPEDWENPTVDTTMYYQTCIMAWEVDQETYQQLKSDGSLCQEFQGKYYVGDNPVDTLEYIGEMIA